MKVYEAVFKEGEMEGVYSLSVVENPAMQDLWIALSEQPQTVELAQVDEEKRLLLGAALIPNKKIYRKVDDHEFYITFSEQTIEKLAHNFFKNGNQNNSSLEHQIKLEGMSVVEGWTVVDPKNDKSNNYGKEYPKGTFVTMMKVDNDDVWSKVKSGEIKGFSIDALLSLEEIKLNTNINMTKEDFIDAFKAVFNKEPKAVEEVEVIAEEVVAEAKEAEVVDLSTDAMKEALTEVLAQFSVDQEAKFEAFKLEFTKVEKEVEAKDEKIKELEVQLSKEPEAEPIKSNPENRAEPIKLSSNANTRDRVAYNLANNLWR
jgi:hypothetical protein